MAVSRNMKRFIDHNDRRTRFMREKADMHNWKKKLSVIYQITLGRNFPFIEKFIENLLMETLKEATRREPRVMLEEFINGK